MPQPGPTANHSAEPMAPDLLEAKIARAFAREAARSAASDTSAATDGARLNAASRPSKLPSLGPYPDANEDDLSLPSSRSPSIKAGVTRYSLHTAAGDEGRHPTWYSKNASLANSQAASGAASPARSVSAVDAVNSSRETSPPPLREPSRPRAQSTPAPALSTSVAIFEDVAAQNGRRERAQPAESVRTYLRPSSFDKAPVDVDGARPWAAKLPSFSAAQHEADQGLHGTTDGDRPLSRPTSFSRPLPTGETDRRAQSLEAGTARAKLRRPSSFDKQPDGEASRHKPVEPEAPRRMLPPARTEDESRSRPASMRPADDDMHDGNERYRPELEMRNVAELVRKRRPGAVESPRSPHPPTPSSHDTNNSSSNRLLEANAAARGGRRAVKGPSFRVQIPSDSSDASEGEEARYARSPGPRASPVPPQTSGSDSDTSQPTSSPTTLRRRMPSLSILSRCTSEGSDIEDVDGPPRSPSRTPRQHGSSLFSARVTSPRDRPGDRVADRNFGDRVGDHVGERVGDRIGDSEKLAAATLTELQAALNPLSPSIGEPSSAAQGRTAFATPSAIDTCLVEVEAALNTALRIKEDRVGMTAPQGPLAAIAQGGEPAPTAKRKVHIVLPERLPRASAAAAEATGLPARPTLMVGSGMLRAGEWNNQGWQELSAEGVVPIPAILQQIDASHIQKVRELGRGQFGSVSLARWLGVDVAVKELRSNDAHGNAEMLREAELLASLCHPCITTIYGVLVGHDSPATVLEFVRGGSLRQGLSQLKARGGAPPRLRCAIALQAARGLEYLHSRHVVHFDVKSENLLADLRDPSNPVVKIADMGLSKRSAATTVSGNMRGTLPWMAPELFPSAQADPECGTDRVTEKVDVFSFGVCMWEIWTLGEAPYPGLKLHAVFSGVASGSLRPRPLADAPPAWTGIMHACWAGSPSARPSFSQVAARLAQLLLGLPDTQ